MFSYGKQVVLENVSMQIERGDFLGIIGPNGGGKSTLLRLMLGLLKPDSGDITLMGQFPSKSRRLVGYIPQETNLNKEFPITVRDVVLMGLASRRGFGKKYTVGDKRKVDIIIGRLGLTPLRDRPLVQLSGGQRQKVLLARAMVADPDMLILDEPTASVDTTGEDEVYEHLRLLNKTGVTIVLVTHNVSVLSKYIKSVACVNKQLYFHPDGTLTQDTVNKTFGCPVDIIAHGVPHRVFHDHSESHTHD